MNSSPKPPAFFIRFFRWFCHPDYREDIEGDLLERFEQTAKSASAEWAKWFFALEVLKLFRPAIIKPIGGIYRMNQLGMFKNYMKVGWRNMLRQKLYSSINVGGLTLGLTAFILIFLYIKHELSYDRFYPNADKIYRAYQQQTFNPFMGSDYFAVMPAAFAETLMREYPEVEYATCLQTPTTIITHEQSHYMEPGLSADPNFFRVFPYQFLRGNPKTALSRPENIVLTETLAHKLFGTKDPMDELLAFGGRDVKVAAVIKDPPKTSSLQFTHVVSVEADSFYLDDKAQQKWKGNAFYAFFTLVEGADAKALEAKMPDLLKKYWAYPEYPAYLLQPLSEMHLQANVNFELGSKGSVPQLTLFSVVAALILILACINYMNLAIARSIRRAKEVGLRKVIGAHKWQLALQFLGESVFVTLIALALSVLLLPLLLPYFGQMVDRELDLIPADVLLLAPGLFLLVLIVGVLSGSYPAVVMSSLPPVMVLKGRFGGPSSGLRLQKWLIIGQYTVSIAMIVCSLIIYSQFRFISQRELGFDKEHVFTIRSFDSNIKDSFDAIKSEWLANPNVVAVSISQNLPTNIEQSNVVSLHKEGEEPEYKHTTYQLRTDENFLDVFGMKLVAGRSLSEEYALDRSSENCLLNETGCRAFGWTAEEALGKTFETGWEGRKTVVGVLKDFHMHSMRMSIEPLMVQLRTNFSYISVKVRPGSLPETASSVEETFRKYSPYPFDYEFLDDNFDKLYKSDTRQGEIFGFFTVVALLIACLGLFGLAAFHASQRTKEVGIRKVLGASTSGLVALLSSSFLRLVVLSFVLAVPLAWYGATGWLESFAYRVEVAWWMFVVPGVAALLLAFFTVGYQSLKAAASNPVDSLRNE